MNDRENEIIKDVVDVCSRQISSGQVYLFGSRAKDIATQTDDFDFAVNADNLCFENKEIILQEVEDIAGLYKIDVVFFDEIDDSFKNIITNTGRIIYEC